uniref:Subtilisin-like protease fibronectin type-III domain-containing protein n=1 Tax=Salix viminalis TaxID=40686 RepID=A0A6N2MBM8_SALVM
MILPSLLPFLFLTLLQRPTFASIKPYVVYLGGHSHGPSPSSFDANRVRDSHYEFLGSFLGSREFAQDAIFYSYTRHINGFAATLEDEVAAEIAKHPEVVSVFLNQGRKQHTTHSWSFLGLEKDGVVPSGSIWKKARFGEDTIIGNLDTGAWPESESFSDEGLGPIPSKWKGICQNGSDPGFHCNSLLGPGTSTKGMLQSLAISIPPSIRLEMKMAMDPIPYQQQELDASVFLLGQRNSPKARVAAYKVCYPPVDGDECFDADILAAFDAAISDGVDVLSVSLGGNPTAFFNDSVAIGSFHAVKHGIVVICSAGNSGPADGTVSNVAPWEITVGASTMDREFPSYVVLGNNISFKGESLSTKPLPENKLFPLMSAADARAANASVENALLCMAGSLDPGKICLRGINARVDKGQQAALAGAVGMVLANNKDSGNEIIADPHVLPASHINYTSGVAIFKYINSTEYPVAYITLPVTKIGTKPDPVMAAFSSKGPNTIAPDILKPDITAPGVSVIAAFTEAQGPTNQDFDRRRVLFNSISGTSMSCPHVSGVVGLLKTLHPTWSPASIKSAIMTTAMTRDNTMEPILNANHTKASPFSYGAGHIRPNQAMDPGLVYDLTVNDYLNFLCALGYSDKQISTFSDTPYECPTKPINLASFNYPSITVPTFNGSITLSRTVKNVGSPGTYRVRIRNPTGVSVSVEPEKLEFKKIGEEKAFTVTLEGKDNGGMKDYVFGELIWSDRKHHVRSPIVVKWF